MLYILWSLLASISNSEEFQTVDATTTVSFLFCFVYITLTLSLLLRPPVEPRSPSVLCVKSFVNLYSAFHCRSFPNNYWDKFIKRKVSECVTLICHQTVFFLFPFLGLVLQHGSVTKAFSLQPSVAECVFSCVMMKSGNTLGRRWKKTDHVSCWRTPNKPAK